MSTLRHSLYNLAGSVTPLILALVTIPLYINLIGAERYGVLAIVWLILGYFGLFDLGLGRAVAQRIAVLREATIHDRAALFWTAAFINIGIGVIGGMLLWFSADLFLYNFFKADPALVAEAVQAIPWLACAVPIATLTGVASGALQGCKKFLDVNLASIIGASLFQVLPLAVAFWVGAELSGLILAAIAARLIGLLVFLSSVYAHILKGAPPHLNRSEVGRLLSFGGWVSLIAVVSPLLVVVDRFFIGALISAFAVTVYAIAFEIVQRISIIPRSIGMALFPRMAEANGEVSQAMAERAVRTIGAIMTPLSVALIFTIRPFLDLWIGGEIANGAGPIAIIVLVAFWTNSLAIIPYSRLQAIGRPRWVAFALLSQVPPYLVALYVAVSVFGLIGAAVTFAVRTIIDALLLHRLSTGSWSVTGSIPTNGVFITVAAGLNFAFSPWTPAWLVSGGVLTVILALWSARQVPSEFKTIAGHWVPMPLFQYLRFV